MEEIGAAYEVLFLEASDDVLIRRFKETRRRHPLATVGSITEGLKKERKLLAEIRARADKLIDTSFLSPQELKQEIKAIYAPDGKQEIY